MSDFDAGVSATADFVESVPVHNPNSGAQAASEDFVQCATWSLKRLAAWLETASIVADDEEAQHVVDATKMLIAEQARQAAANLRTELTARGQGSIC